MMGFDHINCYALLLVISERDERENYHIRVEN